MKTPKELFEENAETIYLKQHIVDSVGCEVMPQKFMREDTFIRLWNEYQPKWVSVKERLPENLGWTNDRVLFVVHSGIIYEGCYDYEDGLWSNGSRAKYMDAKRVDEGKKPNGAIVTHWMLLNSIRLPPLPTEK